MDNEFAKQIVDIQWIWEIDSEFTIKIVDSSPFAKKIVYVYEIANKIVNSRKIADSYSIRETNNGSQWNR